MLHLPGGSSMGFSNSGLKTFEESMTVYILINVHVSMGYTIILASAATVLVGGGGEEE